MIVNNNFKFTLNVSSEGYQVKTDATCCLSSKGAKAISRKKMCFFEESLNVDEFLEKAENGHSFCALYRFEPNTKYWYSNKAGQKFIGYPYYQNDRGTATKGGLKIDFKRDEYFTGSQVIFIDIDFTKYTNINDYIDALKFKPTCIYMSYSDNKDKGGVISRRFHLVYVFDKILSKEEFKDCSILLSEALVFDTGEELEDKCGEKMSQYMNGCFGNNENYKTYSIYSVEDIKNYSNNIYNNTEEDIIEDRSTTFNLKLQKEEIEPENIFDESLLSKWDRLDIEKFLKCRDWENYRRTTKYYYRTEKDTWIKDLYQSVDESYFKLFWNINKVCDGSKRRKNLFQRMCLRKVINSNITPMELVVNTIIDIVRFYDNSDKVLDSDFIKRNILNCIAMSVEDIEDKFKTELDYLRSNTKPKNGIIYKSKIAHSKETTFLILDDYYNPSLDVKQNLEYINNECGYIVSQRTLYNYLKERGIKTDSNKLTDEEIFSLIDFSKSAIANYTILKESGIKISKNRLYSIYNSNINNNIDIKDTNTTTFNLKLQKEEMDIEPIINPSFDIYSSLDFSFNNFLNQKHL